MAVVLFVRWFFKGRQLRSFYFLIASELLEAYKLDHFGCWTVFYYYFFGIYKRLLF